MTPALLAVGAFRPTCRAKTWFLGVLSLALAAKLLWCGSALAVAVGSCLLAAFAASLAGQTPYVLEVIVYVANAVRAGFEGLGQYSRQLRLPITRLPWLNALLPLAALAGFGMIFIPANPDLLSPFSKTMESLVVRLRAWSEYSADAQKREAGLERFHEYAYQWY